MPLLLEAKNLVVRFEASGRRELRAVDGVSFAISRGRTLGVVGESGCGKSTLARALLRLVPVTAGQIFFDGMDVLSLNGAALRRFRRRVQMVFQDPGGSLNSRMRIGRIVADPLVIHRVARGRNLRERVVGLLEQVGLSASDMDRFPHELSGGQRQRVGIARAIALEPELLVCDEPVSALDVSVQAQIMNLMGDLRNRLGLSFFFIAHNLAVVEHFCDDVAVMYLGRIVEHGPARRTFSQPRHPYTLALKAAVPEPDPQRRGLWSLLPGEPPSPIEPPSGCAFHPRCPFATDICRERTPVLETKTGMSADHRVACHHADQPLSLTLSAAGIVEFPPSAT